MLSVFSALVAFLASLGFATASTAAPPSAPPSAPLAVDTVRPAGAAVEIVPFPRPELPELALKTEHAMASPEAVGFSREGLRRAERALEEEFARGGFPGAALAIGRYDQVVVERGIGRLGWDPAEPRVDPDYTVYDIASLTKVVAATTAVMLLVEDGLMELDERVSTYLPEFVGDGKARVTIRQLLTHTSGLPAGANLWAPSPAGALERALAVPLKYAPGQRVEYSDIGFVVLWAAAERAAGEPLFRLLDRRVYGPLKMYSTTFLPGELCGRCAPTARRPDGSQIRGRVHDPTALRLGGVTGNAGLFSTAHDLGRFAAMLANGGELDGVRVLREETIREFTRRQPGAGTRALGWDTPNPNGTGAAGQQISPRAFGHTGFTGTSLWVDPDRGTWTVFLSNRTYAPRAANRIQAVRRSVHDWVALSATGSGAGPALAR
jgi:CubicO group peptidase (beta-lactamase class C family)